MNTWLAAAVLVIAGAVFLARRQDQVLADAGVQLDQVGGDQTDDQPDQLPGVIAEISVTLDPTTYTPAAVSNDTAAANEKAFLDMIAYSEGTAGADGYRALFGYPLPGRLAENLDDHPGLFFSFTDKAGRVLRTSAAGRYQFLLRTWRELARTLQLPDFGPASQDAAALELIRQRGALNDVRAGRLQAAIAKCAPIWASLPGAGYSQPERQFSTLASAYQAAGGTFEA